VDCAPLRARRRGPLRPTTRTSLTFNVQNQNSHLAGITRENAPACPDKDVTVDSEDYTRTLIRCCATKEAIVMRWLLILAFSCAACSPSQAPDPALALCQRVEQSCVVTLDASDFWREPPLELAPNEAVVQVIYLGGYATTTRSSASDYLKTSSDEVERACTRVTPIAVHNYRVARVVSGDFQAAEFSLLAQGGYDCGNSNVALGLTTPPGYVDYRQAYLVIRPATSTEGIFPLTSRGLGPDGVPVDLTLPLMMHRVEGKEIPGRGS